MNELPVLVHALKTKRKKRRFQERLQQGKTSLFPFEGNF